MYIDNLIQLAVKLNHLSFTNLLLDFGANPNCRNDYDSGYSTPLTHAAENNYFSIASLLIDFGADVTASDNTGLTCLHLGAKNDCYELCALLITRGCDRNIRDKFGNTASYWAKKNKFFELEKFLGPPNTITPLELKEHKDLVDEYTFGFTAEDKKKMQPKGGKKKK